MRNITRIFSLLIKLGLDKFKKVRYLENIGELESYARKAETLAACSLASTKDTIRSVSMKRLNLVGQKFGRLEVVSSTNNKDSGGRYFWRCLCVCGKFKEVRGSDLKAGNVKSCGCLKLEGNNLKHGQSVTREYQCWNSMMGRCYNSNNKRYKNYGGRGIKVCDRWHTFENFYEDMGKRPKGLTLDRRDNSGDYCPENCRWATYTEQANNKRNSVWKEYRGETRTVAQWGRVLGIPKATLWDRLYNGWSIERAFSTPAVTI